MYDFAQDISARRWHSIKHDFGPTLGERLERGMWSGGHKLESEMFFKKMAIDYFATTSYLQPQTRDESLSYDSQYVRIQEGENRSSALEFTLRSSESLETVEMQPALSLLGLVGLVGGTWTFVFHPALAMFLVCVSFWNCATHGHSTTVKLQRKISSHGLNNPKAQAQDTARVECDVSEA